MTRRAPALAAALLLLASAASAQSPESDPAHDIPVAAPPPGGFLVPDVPQSTLDATKVHSDKFSLTFGLAILGDYTNFTQDDANIEQVGTQEDQFEVRDFRFMGRGHFHVLTGWRYQASVQYKGFAQDAGDPDWQIADFNFTTSLGKSLGDMTLGKEKQTFIYEMVGDAANLPQSERLLSPFFRSRDVGLKLMNSVLNGRATWAVGWFNDWWVRGNSFEDNGQQFSARLTGLPVWRDDSKRYLHLALSGRYNGARNDTLRFVGAPESNVSTNYLDTGPIEADHAWILGLEALYADGPFSVLAEYSQTWVDDDAGSVFSGWYVVGSVVLTGGGPRPYDRKVAYARRMPVTHRHGEVELVARYGEVDLDDGDIDGGILGKWYLGVNWWATKRWKAGLGYGKARLDKDGLIGNAGILLTRLQWIY